MPNCKICGRPVRCATVTHAACWENEVSKMAEIFCDEYCRYPRECQDDESLAEHCDNCALVRVLNLGL